MKHVKVTRKFQVTIPRELAEAAGIKVGDVVSVDIVDDGSIVIRKINVLEELAGILNPGRGVEGLAEELDRERKCSER